MLESGAEGSALGASLRGTRHSSSRRWLEHSEEQYPTTGSHEQTNNCPEHHLRIPFRTRSLIRFNERLSPQSESHKNRPDTRGVPRTINGRVIYVRAASTIVVLTLK